MKAAREKVERGGETDVDAMGMTRLGLVVRAFLGGGEVVRALAVVFTVAASCRLTPVVGGDGGIVVAEGRGAARREENGLAPSPHLTRSLWLRRTEMQFRTVLQKVQQLQSPQLKPQLTRLLPR